MRLVWRRGPSTVEGIRRALPPKQRGAYTTVQTTLNRLAERGLLKREMRGKAITYSPALSEADYLANSLDHALRGASEEARRAALAALVGRLKESELDEIRSLAREVGRKRRRS
jgi:BlaI family transcriptional regulator, penicillinase repressor